mgnify:CR=1 FL=1
MADVYKFKVTIKEVPDKIWRDIEISSLSSVAKLGYTILASFEAAASHLFNIKFNGKRYEIVIEDDFEFEPVIDPIKTKLSALKLSIGDVLEMEYDYGAGWEFTIELLSITEMKKGSGNHYPYVTAGQGKGIIENIPPFELAGIIEETDKTGILPQVCDNFLDEEIEWDYRKFDLEYCNVFLKGEIEQIQYAYEEY